MEASDIRTVGVIGCGLMGAGIAEVCSRSGFSVVVREVDTERLQKGLGSLRASLTRAVAKGKLTQDEMEAIYGNIHGTMDPGDLSDCDIVIEAAAENMALKKEIFKELDRTCKPDALLTSNTSSLCITEIASATNRPEQVLGLHFFNPVPVMPLLEIVPGLLTPPEVLDTACQFGQVLGKTAVITKDRPGFIVNLLLVPFLLDAIGWLDANLATREDIDSAVRLGLGHPMGPLSLSDFIGLDTVLSIADALYGDLREPRYVAPPLLRRMVQAGLLGRKSGRGFYTYSG